MSKETKQDRLVRVMYDQMAEHVLEIKHLNDNPNTKEMDVERWAQSVLKNCLGYTASSGYSIIAQEQKGKMRPDLVVQKAGASQFVIEVKKISFDLDKSDFRSGKIQLAEYLNTLGNIRYGILCNGLEWRLFSFADQSLGGIEIGRIDFLQGAESIDTSKKAIEEFCYSFLDFHETAFSSCAWDELTKEATAFSPESLARAILSANTMKHIAKEIRGEHEYKANAEILLDRVFHILQKGMDDAVPGWNEAKVLEFSKYLKTQKRQARKPRRSSKKGVDSPDGGTVNAEVAAAAPPCVPSGSTEGEGSAA